MTIEVRIRPNSSLTLVDFPELWHHRDLISILVWRDFSVRYKQTILGPIWFLLQPLLPTVVFTIVFGGIAKMPTEGIPTFLFFLCNQIIWGFFAASYTSTAGSLLGNLTLFTKVYLPRLVIPLASLISNAITILVQLGLFVAAWLWFRYGAAEPAALQLTLRILWLPLLLALAATQGLGFGLWMASLTAKYRDLQQLSAIILQLWMYASAVIFPLSHVPEKYRELASLNPITFLIEAFRYSLLGVGTVSLRTGIYSVGLSLLVLLGGLYVFNRTARTFVDIA